MSELKEKEAVAGDHTRSLQTMGEFWGGVLRGLGEAAGGVEQK